MADWLKNVEPLTQKGQIRVPYTWSVGETGSRFLTALRDQGRILANRCPHCSKVFVPPRKNCGRCFQDIDEQNWLDLPLEGTVTACTIVRENLPVSPAPTPFAYVLIRLDGADVDFLHIVKDRLDRLATGARVRARLRDSRAGSVLDIDAFEPI
jgi:hypothetical protein